MNLVYLSPVPWDSFSQRPHELVSYFHAHTGGRVVWVDPYPTRLPSLNDLFPSGKYQYNKDVPTPDWIEIVKPRAIPIEPLPFSSRINGMFWTELLTRIHELCDKNTILGIGKPSELALNLLSTGTYSWTFYDAMDDFPAFYRGLSRISMSRKSKMTSSRVSTILTSSSNLKNRFSQISQDVRLVLNACATQRLPPVSDKQCAHKSSKPVVGYVGTIGHWFDWDLVIKIARANPAAQFRLIGPVHVRIPASIPSNISVEPVLPHAEALKTMLEFDIGFIPFKLTQLTSSVDPIKYYEYKALGLPIISSAFGEMALRGEERGVWLVASDTDMTGIVDDALSYSMTSELVGRFRQDNSWEARFGQSHIFDEIPYNRSVIRANVVQCG